MFWFATSFPPVMSFGLRRRGHPLFGNGVSLVNWLGVATLIGFGEKRGRENLPLGVTGLPNGDTN